MKKQTKHYWMLCALCFLSAFLFTLCDARRQNEALASRISPDILRFHVLANSNSPRDQSLKLAVKTLVVCFVSDHLGNLSNKEETAHWLMEHKDEIESLARAYLLSQNAPSEVRLTLSRDYFPTKSYGDLVFPCGVYDAARLTIGKGSGRNWWCVLYPPLCYTDAIHAVVPESSKELLQELLASDDYEALIREASEKPRVTIRLRLPELLNSLFSGSDEPLPAP